MDAKAIDALRDRCLRDGQALAQGRLRIQVRFPPPRDAEDFGAKFDASSYRLDLEEGRLEILDGAEVRGSASVELIGSFAERSEIWSWAWSDPTLPPARYAEARRACERAPELSRAFSSPSFPADLAFAGTLSAWVALKMGWLGAFEAARPEGPTRFVAVKEIRPPDDRVFCAFCFGNATDHALTVAQTAPGLGICGACAELVCDVFAEKAGDAGVSVDDLLATPSPAPSALPELVCFACGAADHLVHEAHASLCGRCARAALREVEGAAR